LADRRGLHRPRVGVADRTWIHGRIGIQTEVVVLDDVLGLAHDDVDLGRHVATHVAFVADLVLVGVGSLGVRRKGRVELAETTACTERDPVIDRVDEDLLLEDTARQRADKVGRVVADRVVVAMMAGTT